MPDKGFPGELSVRSLNAYYGSAHVLFDVDLDAKGGRCLVVLGRNGAGKTTLLKSIMHLGVRTEGEVAFSGRRLSSLPTHAIARLGIQLVPEGRRVLPNFSVRQNLQLARLGAKEGGRPGRPVEEVLEIFPTVKPLLDRRGYALSGGEQQLVAIARAVAAGPTVLLMDEPSAGLAPVILDTVHDAVQLMRRELDLTLVVVEQNARFGMAIADNIAVIDEGRISFRGSAEAFRGDPELERRYLSI